MHPRQHSFSTATNHSWNILEAMGGGPVNLFRSAIESEYRLAEASRVRLDHGAARRHTEKAEALFERLEGYLAYAGAR